MEKKRKVFRNNYDRLKGGFTCCTEVATLLYSKELIGQEVRDSKDPDKILSAVEKVLSFKEETWDILIKDVMADPPLNSLANMMLAELEDMPDRPAPRKNHSAPIEFLETEQLISNERSLETRDGSPSKDPPAHPVSLTFNSDTNSPTIDSGNWTSDKHHFPMFPPPLPTIPSINEGDDLFDLEKSEKNDSGIIVARNGSNMINDDVESTPSPSSSFFLPQVAQTKNERLSQSEMVSPNKGNLVKEASRRGSTPKHNVQSKMDALVMKCERLKIENTHLNDTLSDMRTENDELMADIDSVNEKREEELKMLECKLEQLADDNRLLSQKIQEKRHLEAENGRLVQEAKLHKRELERHRREIKQLKACLEMAERNARIQSISIDKLRDKVASQEATIRDYKSNQFHHWLHQTSEDSD